MTIRTTLFFEKQIKRLSKTYSHVKKDCYNEMEQFLPERSFSLGSGLFKVRVKNSDIPCGKSGGYRLIVFFHEIKDVLVPLLVYSKRDRGNVTEQEIEHALQTVLQELNASSSSP